MYSYIQDIIKCALIGIGLYIGCIFIAAEVRDGDHGYEYCKEFGRENKACRSQWQRIHNLLIVLLVSLTVSCQLN